MTNQLFTLTFATCFMLVGANSLVPCPVDGVHGNDSIIDERILKHEELRKRNAEKNEQI